MFTCQGRLRIFIGLAVGLLLGACSMDEKSGISANPKSWLSASHFMLPDSPGLSFPYKDYRQVQDLRCFGLYPWGGDETHGGIDIVAKYDPLLPELQYFSIQAPAKAIVVMRMEHSNGPGRPLMISLVMEINSFWYAIYTFEPQTLSEKVIAKQRAAIVVDKGQTVMKSQHLGDLVVGEVVPDAYAHIHFSFLYKNPGDTLAEILEQYNKIIRSNGKDLAPKTGPGSPWEPREIRGLPTTLFCPYEYSSPLALTFYDELPKKNAIGGECLDPCAYGSKDGDCGSSCRVR